MTVNVAPVPPVGAFLDSVDLTGQILAGGYIQTFLAGTITPLATYADPLGNTPNSTTIQLDNASLPETGGIYLDLTKSYKFIWFDAEGDQVSVRDNITGNPYSVDQIVYTAGTDIDITSNVISVNYPKTTVEQAAGVTPVNYSIAPYPIDPRRYGGDNTGATFSDAAWTSTIAVARKSTTATGGRAIYVNGTYKVTTLNFSSQGAVDFNTGFTMYGDGNDSSIINIITTTANTGIGVDLGCMTYFSIRDLQFNFGTSTADCPQVGLLLSKGTFTQSQYAISSITKASSAIVTVSTVSVSNPFGIGETLIFAGVGGMTQINGLTGAVTSTGGTSGAWTATVNINSTSFSTYTSGGTVGPPAAIIFSGIGQFQRCIFNAYGSYNVYDICAEQIDFNNCVFLGLSATTIPVVLSRINTANITSPNFTVTSQHDSMTTISFSGSESTISSMGSGANYPSVLFDIGASSGIAGINFYETYFPCTGATSIVLADNGLSGSILQNISANNMESEQNGSSGTQQVAVFSAGSTRHINLHGYSAFPAGTAQTVPLIVFGNPTFGSNINWNGNVTQSNPTHIISAPMGCAGCIFQVDGNASTVSVAAGSQCLIMGADATLGNLGTIGYTGGIGLFGNTPPGQSAGWGSPTGGTVIANFPGTTATLVQTSEVVAELIVLLKALGLLAA